MLVGFFSDPKVIVGFVATIVSALVALTVVILTQRATDRRSRREFLTKKLEELYLELSALPDDVFNQWNHMWDIIERKVDPKVSPLLEEDLYGHDRAKKVAMYVRLYFPCLQDLHASQFRVQSKFNEAVHGLLAGDDVDMHLVKEIMMKNGDSLQLLESAIIQHKEALVNGKLIKIKVFADAET